ncbi:MAG: hypothetical protein II936_10150 [Oscillospiraceae bacterium]|nr:hypothetical protein [Oscillospiraceae bacterium]
MDNREDKPMDECITRTECKTCQDKYDAENDRQNHRISALEQDIKQLHSLTVSVEKMAVSLEQMAKQLEKQGEKLEAIEAEPAQKWKNAVWLVVAGLIGAALTMMLSGIHV